MASLVFIYGGVSPREMVKALIVLLCTAIMLGTVGIFISTWLKRTARATVISYLVVLFLLGAPTFIYGIAALIRGGEPPRWLLVPSPVSALFSAIAPSTSLGSSSLSLIGGFSMLMAGNIGFFETNTIPRPLYHYTLPLYGLITLMLYFFASRLVRPARRWRIRLKEILMVVIVVLIFIGIVVLAFFGSSDRYENVSIFFAPTPFMLMPVEPMMEQAVMVEPGLPVTDEEAVVIYSAVLQTIHNEGLLDDIEFAAISQQTYTEPSAPEFSTEIGIDELVFSDNFLEGIAVAADELPFDVIWVNDYEALNLDDLADPDQKGDVLILFSNLNPLKTGILTLFSTVYYADQPNQNLTIQLSNFNGPWEVVSLERPKIQQLQPYPEPATDEAASTEIPNEPLSFAEISEIYAAAVLQAYLVDNPLPEANLSELYLLQNTGLAVDSITLPPEVQDGIKHELEDLPFSVIWEEIRPENPGDNAAIITFGYILPHDDQGAVEVMIDFYFDESNAALVTYILRKIDGKWQVTEFGGMG
jgi:hypothetical protein